MYPRRNYLGNVISPNNEEEKEYLKNSAKYKLGFDNRTAKYVDLNDTKKMVTKKQFRQMLQIYVCEDGSKGEYLFSEEQFDRALPILLKEMNDGINKYGYYRIAVCYEALGNNKKSVEFFKKTLNEDSRFIWAWQRGGGIYMKMKKYKIAVKWYNNAITLSPKNYSFLYNRSKCYQVLKEWKKVIEDSKKVVKYKPDYYDAWYNIGEAFFFLDDYQNCINEFINFVEKVPKNGWGFIKLLSNSHLFLALSYEKIGKGKIAEKHYNESLSLKPDNSYSLYNFGMRKFFNGDTSKGRDLLWKSSETEDEELKVHFLNEKDKYSREKKNFGRTAKVMSKLVCGYCEELSIDENAKKIRKLKLCSRCKKIYYCSRECQKKHWKKHKAVCFPFEKK